MEEEGRASHVVPTLPNAPSNVMILVQRWASSTPGGTKTGNKLTRLAKGGEELCTFFIE